MDFQRIKPDPGQESVWDYPRPPRLEASTRHIRVEFNGVVLADTRHALRILETSHPPVYYFPPEDVQMEYLVPTSHATYCEWKGTCSYSTVSVNGKSAPNAAWSYHQPANA